MPDQKLLSVADVAAYCGVDRTTVRRWIHNRELSVYRLGQQFRIRESDLKAFLKRKWIQAAK